MNVPSLLGRYRRALLNVFLASIAVNAVLGIWALLIDDFGQTQGKVLATSFLVSATMLSILVNGSPLEKQLLWPIPVIAGASAALGFVIFIVMVWTEMDESTPLKLAISGLVVGAGGTLAGLLQLFSLRAIHEPLRRANLAVITMLVLATLSAIWFEIDAEWFVRFIGVLSVLAAAMILAIPALAKFLPPEPAPTKLDCGVHFCPSCGEPLQTNHDESYARGTCGRCGVGYVVSVETPVKTPKVPAAAN